MEFVYIVVWMQDSRPQVGPAFATREGAIEWADERNKIREKQMQATLVFDVVERRFFKF